MEVDKVKGYIVAILELSIPASAATPPATLTAQLVTFVLSHLGVESDPNPILHATLKESLQTVLTSLGVDLLRAGLDPTHPLSDSTPWSTLSRLVPSGVVVVLGRCCRCLSVLLTTHLAVVTTPSCQCDLTALLHTFHDAWDDDILPELTRIVSGLELDPDPCWSGCLATVCVCVMASEVWGVLERCGVGGEGEWLQAGQLLQLLNNLDQKFPSAMYCKYQEWEEQEVGVASVPVVLPGGGVILKVC